MKGLAWSADSVRGWKIVWKIFGRKAKLEANCEISQPRTLSVDLASKLEMSWFILNPFH